jgi:hypothetical protein
MKAKIRFVNEKETFAGLSLKYPEIFITPNKILHDSFSFLTATHDTENYVLALTPTKLYTNWEKLFLPFDKLTWIFLILTLLGSFLMIFMINRMQQTIQEMINGPDSRISMFSLISIFFGIGQRQQVPVNNTGRIILMNFILFNLVIRTAYQGVMFDMMTKDMSKPGPKTIQDLIDMDYKVIFQDGRFGTNVNQILFEVLDGQLRQQLRTTRKYDFFFTNLFKHFHANRDVKLAYFESETFFRQLQFRFKSENLKGFSILEEKLLSVPVGMSVVHQNVFFEVLDDTVQWLITGGIVDWAKRVDLRNNYRPFNGDVGGPKVLVFSDLSHGFAIWLTMCGFSFFTFLLEFLFVSLLSRTKGTGV